MTHDAPAVEEPVYYPVLLSLHGRTVVVIGGGAIATQKVRGLLDAGAHITLVSPTLSPPLAALAASSKIAVVARAYRPGDLAGAMIAIAATDDRQVNRAVWEEAEARGVLLNAVDDVPHCHFIAPSVLRRGSVVVAVSSSGKCPALAVRLRERIGSIVLEAHGKLADRLGTLRADVTRRVPEPEARTRLWYRIVDALVDAPSDGRQLPDEPDALLDAVFALASQPREDETGVLDSACGTASRPGTVYLVGAGPGHPGLLTVRGLELLRSADVVVHDRLVSSAILALANPRARLIDVGKRGYAASVSQHSITALLAGEARRGARVVRLKGGDPFVFGRGGEETACLARAGVPCEVVPGITSAIAAPAAAGIPVTHRAFAAGFAVVSAQQSGEGPELDWEALARMPTLVVLMGLRALGDVVARLLRHGASVDTPAAVISEATLPEQRVVIASLGSITSAVHDAGLKPPATLIIGEIVRLGESTAALSFAGRRVAACEGEYV